MKSPLLSRRHPRSSFENRHFGFMPAAVSCFWWIPEVSLQISVRSTRPPNPELRHILEHRFDLEGSGLISGNFTRHALPREKAGRPARPNPKGASMYFFYRSPVARRPGAASRR